MPGFEAWSVIPPHYFGPPTLKCFSNLLVGNLGDPVVVHVDKCPVVSLKDKANIDFYGMVRANQHPIGPEALCFRPYFGALGCATPFGNNASYSPSSLADDYVFRSGCSNKVGIKEVFSFNSNMPSALCLSRVDFRT